MAWSTDGTSSRFSCNARFWKRKCRIEGIFERRSRNPREEPSQPPGALPTLRTHGCVAFAPVGPGRVSHLAASRLSLPMPRVREPLFSLPQCAPLVSSRALDKLPEMRFHGGRSGFEESSAADADKLLVPNSLRSFVSLSAMPHQVLRHPASKKRLRQSIVIFPQRRRSQSDLAR
jgi:hypothetical protein